MLHFFYFIVTKKDFMVYRNLHSIKSYYTTFIYQVKVKNIEFIRFFLHVCWLLLFAQSENVRNIIDVVEKIPLLQFEVTPRMFSVLGRVRVSFPESEAFEVVLTFAKSETLNAVVIVAVPLGFLPSFRHQDFFLARNNILGVHHQVRLVWPLEKINFLRTFNTRP